MSDAHGEPTPGQYGQPGPHDGQGNGQDGPPPVPGPTGAWPSFLSPPPGGENAPAQPLGQPGGYPGGGYPGAPGASGYPTAGYPGEQPQGDWSQQPAQPTSAWPSYETANMPQYGPPGPPGAGPTGFPPPPGKPRRRGLIFGSLGLVLVVLAGVLTYVLWPSSSGGGTNETPDQMAAAALKDLGTWPGITYGGAATAPDASVTGMTLTVDADGSASGHLSRGFGAQADLAVDSSGSYLKGNQQWWMWDTPGGSNALADKWVSGADATVTDLIDPTQLTPAKLATLLGAQPTGASASPNHGADEPSSGPTGPKWKRLLPTGTDAQKLETLTDGKHIITVSGTSPHQLTSVQLALSGDTSGSTDGTQPSGGDSTSSDGSVAYHPGTAGVRPAATTLLGSNTNPTVAFAVSKADSGAVQQAKSAAQTAQGGAQAYGTLIPPHATFTVNLDLPDCETDTCPITVNVTATGGPISGTLSVQAGTQNLPPQTVNIPAGQTLPFHFTSQNAATPGGGTVTIQVQSFLYVPSIMGPDPTLAQRLEARGLNPTKVLDANEGPVGPQILQTLDVLTAGANTTNPDDPATEQLEYSALTTVSNAVDNHAFAPFYALVMSGKLKNPGDLLSFTGNFDDPAHRRMLEEAAQRAATDNVVLDGSYQSARADVLDLGNPAQAIAVEEVTARDQDALRTAFTSGIAAFTDGSVTPPPGATKVLLIYLDPVAAEGAAGYDKAGLQQTLQKLDVYTVCAPGGQAVVDKIVVKSFAPNAQPTQVATENDFTCADLKPLPGSGSPSAGPSGH